MLKVLSLLKGADLRLSYSLKFPSSANFRLDFKPLLWHRFRPIMASFSTAMASLPAIVESFSAIVSSFGVIVASFWAVVATFSTVVATFPDVLTLVLSSLDSVYVQFSHHFK